MFRQYPLLSFPSMAIPQITLCVYSLSFTRYLCLPLLFLDDFCNKITFPSNQWKQTPSLILPLKMVLHLLREEDIILDVHRFNECRSTFVEHLYQHRFTGHT